MRPPIRIALVGLVALAVVITGLLIARDVHSDDARMADDRRLRLELKDASCIIFMYPDATQSQIADVRSLAEANPQVSEMAFYSQNDAYQEFRRLFRDKPDLIHSVTAEVLPATSTRPSTTTARL